MADKVGGLFSDKLRGTQADDRLYGLSGNDRLFGLGGDDQLYGDAFPPPDVPIPIQLAILVLKIKAMNSLGLFKEPVLLH